MQLMHEIYHFHLHLCPQTYHALDVFVQKEEILMQFSCPQVPLAHRMFLALPLFVLLTLFGPQVPSAAAQSSAFVRVIHASPYVGTADVFLDGTKLLSSFAFGAVTDYVPLPPGPHKVQIALVGKGIGAAALSQTLAVSPGVTYTVAAVGATPTSLSLEVFVDDNLLTPGSAKVRVYHLSPDVGPISVSTGGNTLISGIIYQQASKYLAIAPASYTFAVDATQVNTSLPLAAILTYQHQVYSHSPHGFPGWQEPWSWACSGLV